MQHDNTGNEGTDQTDAPIAYIPRLHRYYGAFGYAPYAWAQYNAVPFTPMQKSVQASRLGVITTAAPLQPDKGAQEAGAPYNAAAKFFHAYAADSAAPIALGISHVAYDRTHTAADDSNSYFPLPALQQAAAQGAIGSLSARFYGAPTNRSQRITREQDAPALLAMLAEDKVEAAILCAV